MPKTSEVIAYLWSIRRSPLDVDVSTLRRFLSPDERQRADKFRFDEHRNRFVLGRAFLRHVLGQHSGQSPDQIEFNVSALGKPSLAGRQMQNWQFSFSRSGEYSVCGVTTRRDIGVDVESRRKMSDMESVARTILDDADQEYWNCLPATDRPTAFFRIWSRKEARGKADGSGISNGAANIKVPLPEISRSACVMTGKWCLSDWQDFDQAAAAVVLETLPGEHLETCHDEASASSLSHSELETAICVVRTYPVATVEGVAT